MMRVEGLDELNAAFNELLDIDMTDSIKAGVEGELIPETRRNIRAKFDTTGDFPSRVQSEVMGKCRVDMIVRAIYGAVQEYGGTFEITPRQRRFFWAMWYETENEMWKALALSVTYTIPPRPYVRPAVDSKAKATMAEVSAHLHRNIWKTVGG